MQNKNYHYLSPNTPSYLELSLWHSDFTFRHEEPKTNKVLAAEIIQRQQTKNVPDWLKSFPVQAVALAVILGLIYLAAPESLHKLLDFTLRFSPELKYVDGPPPV